MGKPLSCHTLQVNIFLQGRFRIATRSLKKPLTKRPGWFNFRTQALRLCHKRFRYVMISRNTLAIQMPCAVLVNFNLTDQSNLLFHH